MQSVFGATLPLSMFTPQQMFQWIREEILAAKQPSTRERRAVSARLGKTAN